MDKGEESKSKDTIECAILVEAKHWLESLMGLERIVVKSFSYIA